MAVCGAVVPRGKSTWPFAGRLFHAANRLGRLRGGWPPTWRNAGPPPKCTLLVHYNGPKEYTWAAAPRFSMWAANRPANGQVDLPRGTTAPQTAKSICRVEQPPRKRPSRFAAWKTIEITPNVTLAYSIVGPPPYLVLIFNYLSRHSPTPL